MSRGRRFSFCATALAGSCLLALGACSSLGGLNGTAAGPMGQPGIPFSGDRPDPGNQAVLDALTGPLNLRPYHTLTPDEARRQPTFADGVMNVMRQRGMSTTPPPGVTERDIQVQGAAGPLHAKLFMPSNARGPLPVIVYFHGGGWVIADSGTYAASTRALAQQAQAIVVSVDYRRAPEAKFPAQHMDALASYRWALQNAASLGGDPRRIALGGESAGGNLAVATAIAARDARLQMPVHILSVYPIAGSDLNTESYVENANALPLNRAAMAWFFHHTIRSPQDLMDPRINLIAANLRGLPPATIIQAEIDPLRTEGDMLADRLRAAGVEVEQRLFDGTTHEFFGAAPVIEDAREAQSVAAARLRAAFGMR